MDRYDTVVVGAGLCGLSAAYHLEWAGEHDWVLLERDAEVGGLARTLARDGFRFDHAIHILYSRDPYVTDLITTRLLPGNLGRQRRRSFCLTAGVLTEYPYQLHTFGLPAAIVRENLAGFLAAGRAADTTAPAADFETWIRRTYGPGIARHFMLPYNRRQWAWDLRDMATEWMGERVAVPTFAEVLAGALGPPGPAFGANREFWYPLAGGIEALPRALAAELPPERVWRGAALAAVDAPRRELLLADGRRVGYGRLVSTIPLPALASLLAGALPPEIRRQAGELKHNVVHTVSLGLDGPGVGDGMHWVYVVDERAPFHRLSFPGSFSPAMVPAGCSSVQAEISASAFRPCRRETLVRDVLQGLVAIGLLDERAARPRAEGGRVRVAEVVTLDPAYVIHDHGLAGRLRAIRDALARADVVTAGRFGGWAYLNMDHAILAGRAAIAGSGAADGARHAAEAATG